MKSLAILFLLIPALLRAEEPKPFEKKYDLLNLPLGQLSKKTKKEFPYKQVVSFYPAKTFSNYMLGGYERQISPKHVLKVVAGYAYFEQQNLNTGFNNNIEHFSGTRFDIMLKYFIGQDPVAFNGLYAAPFISLKNSKFKYDVNNSFGQLNVWEDGDASSFTAGFIMGAQIPVATSFTIDVYIGNAMVKSSGNYTQASRFMDAYRNSIGLISGLSFGFGF